MSTPEALLGDELESDPAAPAEGRVKSADRVMAVLDHLAERGPLGFSEISAALSLPKSSAHSLLRTMQDRGYLSFDAERREYRLGIRIWELAQAFHEIDDIRTTLKPLMVEVVERTGETVQLATLEGVDAVYLELVESPHPVKLTSRVGARLPAHMSAIGKALLAGLEPDECRRRIRGLEMEALTEHTITSVDELTAELERTRKRGYAVDDEEFAIGLRCVAIAIPDLDGEVVAALSVSMPTPRYSRAAASNARQALADAAVRATRLLGHRGGER